MATDKEYDALFCVNKEFCGGKAYRESEHYPCCSKGCFDYYISQAIELKPCKIRQQILVLRDDAEKRVANIEKIKLTQRASNRLNPTRDYFQARADVLNDLLMVMDAETNCSCC